MKIRQYVEGDFEAVAGLSEKLERQHRQALPELFQEPPPEFAMDSLKKAISKENCKIFVAEAGGNIMGYVLMFRVEHPDSAMTKSRKYLFVKELVVSPTAQRKRIGTQLMEFVEGFAKDNGIPEIELSVWAFNEAAREFYSGRGYKPIQTFLIKTIGK